jgi:hypothetical protein
MIKMMHIISMFLKSIRIGIFRRIFILLPFIFSFSSSFSQPVTISGTVRDELTRKPVRDVNVKVYGKVQGTATDKAGTFTLKLAKVPATLVLSCIGYEDAYFDIMKPSPVPFEFLLRPKSYMLQEVDISTKKYSFLFKDKAYSVFDYDLMGDNVLLLIFRTVLRKSELVLLNRSGDTVAISPLPELPPSSLYRDFLDNVHYLSGPGNAYQCFLDTASRRIDFIHQTKTDSLLKMVKPYLFKMSDRLYFQESYAGGFGTAIGYNAKGVSKQYIRKYVNEKKIAESRDDQRFYAMWNDFISMSRNLSMDNIERDSRFYNGDEARANRMEFYNIIYPVVKTGEDSILVFNFSDDRMEFMDKNGQVSHTVEVNFHKEPGSSRNSMLSATPVREGWRWGSKILADGFTREVYAMFLKAGMVELRRVDLETGKLGKETVLPYIFPEKIEIYKGDAFFLVKGDELAGNWRLVKCRLDR